jgi:hypothetical protein
MYHPDWRNPDVRPSSTRQCCYCGMWHTGTCSLVKKVEYHKDGTIKSIELFERESADTRMIPSAPSLIYRA